MGTESCFLGKISAHELESMLKKDLETLGEWLHRNKLTLNVTKSKFMLIAGSRKLNSFHEVKEKVTWF